ncbi:MAG: alpha/beta hydrolase [Chloroflexota bacterium]|nr:alpha/beta hydrolase [Chloroflexota bacterium]
MHTWHAVRRGIVLLLVVSAGTLAACSGSARPRATPTPALPAALFQDTSCTVSPPAGQPLSAMRCGFLTVPEDRTKPGGRTVRLAAVVIKSTSPHPAPDPMLYLSGGPGQPALTNNMQAFTRDFAAPIQSERDLVFFDQRGTGLSQPALTCTEVNDAFRAALASDVRNAQTAQGQAAALRACHDRLEKQGIDFGAYSSAESAADVADLMQALGYREYNIYGLSYGTRLALETMRARPQHIRSVVLDSTLPPQARGDAEQAATFERALSTLIAGCKGDAACARAYPALEQTYFDLVARANAQPITVEPKDPASGSTARVVVNGDRILSGTFQALYDTGLLPLLPFAAQAIAGGNTSVLTSIAQQVAFTSLDYAQAMQEAVDCNDVTMSLTAQDVADATKGVRQAILDAHIGITTATSLRTAQDLCRTFGITRTDPKERQPVTSAIPTLVLAGAYDPVTPPAWGQLAAKALSHSYFFEFPGSGHGELFGRHDCAVALAAAFFDDPSRKPDGSCVAGLGEPQFLVQ